MRIGRAIARAFAEAGYNIVIHYRASAREASALFEELSQLGVKVWRIRADLRSESACKRVVEQAQAAAGRVDVLVNNAAVFHACPIGQVTSRALRDEFAINLFAPILLTRFFAENAETGCVINLLDRRIAALDPRRIPYTLSKKALAEFTRSAALALAPRIRVNGVAPGPVLPPPGEDASYLKTRAGQIPLRAPVAPEEVARAALFLAESPSITGQIVYVDGGQHLLGEGA